MSQDAPTADNTTAAEAEAERVAAYLRAHPDFFVEHADLLSVLQVPHRSGSAVSLVERQVALLREQNRQLAERLDALMINARYNDQLLNVTRNLVLTLLEEDDLSQVVTATEVNLSTQPGVDACSVILLDGQPQRDSRRAAADKLPQRFPPLFHKQRILCQEVDAATAAWLFPGHPERIQSLALSPIKRSDGHLLAALALGNQAADHFSATLDTLFLSFIADALGAIMHRCR